MTGNEESEPQTLNLKLNGIINRVVRNWTKRGTHFCFFNFAARVNKNTGEQELRPPASLRDGLFLFYTTSYHCRVNRYFHELYCTYLVKFTIYLV